MMMMMAMVIQYLRDYACYECNELNDDLDVNANVADKTLADDDNDDTCARCSGRQMTSVWPEPVEGSALPPSSLSLTCRSDSRKLEIWILWKPLELH